MSSGKAPRASGSTGCCSPSRGRGAAAGAEAESLLRALAADLALGADPLMLELAEPWTGPRPEALAQEPPPQPSPASGGGSPLREPRAGGDWRTAGDTVERLEALALRLVSGMAEPEPEWHQTRAVLGWIERVLRPAVAACGRGRDRRNPGRARRPGCRARPERRAEPRPARGAADRAQFLFARYPRGADPGGLAARLAFGGIAGRAPCPGARQLPGAPGALGLGHREHAHRRRRHRPGFGPHWRASGVGSGERAGHRVRDPAGFGARPAAGRCHLAHFRVLPRRLSRAHRSVRQRGARGRRARRAARDQPACRARRRRPAGARSRRHRPGRGRVARRLPGFRLQTGRLWRWAANPDRRADLAGGWRSRGCLSRLEPVGLWRRRRGPRRARALRSPPRRRRRGAAQPGQPRARSLGQRRLLPVRGRPRARGAPSLGAQSGGLPQ